MDKHFERVDQIGVMVLGKGGYLKVDYSKEDKGKLGFF
jgi:hypothetical protein